MVYLLYHFIAIAPLAQLAEQLTLNQYIKIWKLTPFRRCFFILYKLSSSQKFIKNMKHGLISGLFDTFEHYRFLSTCYGQLVTIPI